MLGSHTPNTETAREAVSTCHTDAVVDTCLTITVGHRADGTLCTTVHFASGDHLQSDAASPDLGLSEPDNVLHDAAHTLLAVRAGLERSPVLERVVDLRPLSQESVDLEEAAVFLFQAWCASLRGEDPGPAIRNARVALDRLDDARIARIRDALAGLPRSRRRPLSRDARRSVAHIEDPDDARDLALDFDEDRRTA